MIQHKKRRASFDLNPATARPMTEKDWRIARAIWEQKNDWMNAHRPGSQLRSARIALQMTTEAVATKLGMESHSYLELEGREKTGAISLRKLQEIAEVLDCEVEFAIRPRGKSFSEKIWDTIVPFAKEIYAKKKGMRVANGFIFASVVNQLFENHRFRRKMGWNKQKFARIKEQCF